MPSSRLFEIVYLLLQRRRMTAAELAERFEVSVRTVYRDIDALSAAGVPVYAIPGKGGGVALMEHCVLDRAAFSEGEQRQLLTALQSLPGDARLGAEEVLAKLSGLFRRSEPDWLQVDMSRWGSAGADNAKFDAVKSAILSHRVLRFPYAGSDGQTNWRRVCPARLVFKGRAWYLQGLCLDRKDWRTFKLTRILALELLEETFAPLPPPPSIEPEGPYSGSVLPVRLRFSPAMAWRVYDEFDANCVVREPDGALSVSAALPEDAWLYGYLLSFGADLKVLKPERLCRRLGQLAKEIWQNSEKADTGCQDCCDILAASNRQEESFMNQQFCQSCGMPLSDALLGTEADGAPSPHYCKYCYQNGAFTCAMTMEEMIEFCTPMMVQANPVLTPEQAKTQMRQFFPSLLRWKK